MFQTPRCFRGKELWYSLGHFVPQSFCTFSRKRFYSKLYFYGYMYLIQCTVHATITFSAEVPFLLPTIFSYTCNAETTELCQLRDISALTKSGNFPLDAKRCRKTTTDKQELIHKTSGEFDICLFVMYVFFLLLTIPT
jgi:hypothetical protein